MNKDLSCLLDPENGGVLISDGDSLNSECCNSYPIIRGVLDLLVLKNIVMTLVLNGIRFQRLSLTRLPALIFQNQDWRDVYEEI